MTPIPWDYPTQGPTPMTLADKAHDVINFLVDNRTNYNEPTGTQVIAALMEIDSKAIMNLGEDNRIQVSFSDESIAYFGNPD